MLRLIDSEEQNCDDQCTAYIGKELDRESELGDHGVRKVDYGLGRFTTIDTVNTANRELK